MRSIARAGHVFDEDGPAVGLVTVPLGDGMNKGRGPEPQRTRSLSGAISDRTGPALQGFPEDLGPSPASRRSLR
jgi:hypothetical protein